MQVIVRHGCAATHPYSVRVLITHAELHAFVLSVHSARILSKSLPQSRAHMSQMSWYRPKANTVPEETASHPPNSRTLPLTCSIGSPRSQHQAIIPMPFGPAISVADASSDHEKTRNQVSKRTSKPPPALPNIPKPEDITVTLRREREAESSLNQSIPNEIPILASFSPDPTLSTLPVEEYPYITEEAPGRGSYLPSPQTETISLPGWESAGAKPVPGPLFSTRTPSPHQNASRNEIVQPPTPPLPTYPTLEGPKSPVQPSPSDMGTITSDAASMITNRSVDSTPRIHHTATLHDNMSYVSVAGSVEEVFAGMFSRLS